MRYRILLCALFLPFCFYSIGSIGQDSSHVMKNAMRNSFILSPENSSKLAVMQSKPINDTRLVKKGYRFIREKEFKKLIKVDLSKVRQISFEDLKWESGQKDGLMHAPLFFQQNVGQGDKNYEFVMTNVGFAAGFTSNSITAFVLKHQGDSEKYNDTSKRKGNRISLNFLNANQSKLEGEQVASGHVNSYKGNNKEKWHNKIPIFKYLINKYLYSGIKMRAEGKSGRLSYSFLLDPMADIRKIRISVDGITNLSIDKSGNLVMITSGGPIVQTKPKFFEKLNDGRKELKGYFVIYNAKEYGFKVINHNLQRKLLIDPEIVFTSYYGGPDREGMLGRDGGANDFIGLGFDIKIGSNGNVYMVGMTLSADFPGTTGEMLGDYDVFVMRLDINEPPSNQLKYATYFGGSSTERGRSIEPMNDGSAYFTGHSGSVDLPTTEGVLQRNMQRSGAYVAKLNPQGETEIVTFLGRAASNHPNSIVFNQRLNEPGYIYVAGSSRGGGDATAGSFQSLYGGGTFDGFVTKLDLNLTRYEYFTYLGGIGKDVIMDLDVNDGWAFVTGMSASTDFPTSILAMQPQHSSINDSTCTGDLVNRECAEAFVAMIHRDGSSKMYSTFYGGQHSEDYARGIAVNSNNNAYITGASKTGTNDSIFIAKFDVGGGRTWEKKLKAAGTDHGEEIVVDELDRAHVTGTISVDGFSSATRTYGGGKSDFFYARVDNGLGDIDDIDYFTYLGGNGEDRGFAIATQGNSIENFCAYVVGSTVSTDINALPTGGSSHAGSADILLYKLCDVGCTSNCFDFSKINVTSSSVRQGENIKYKINAYKSGEGRPVPIVITDTVPSNIEIIEISRVVGRFGNIITWDFSAVSGDNTLYVTGKAKSTNPCSDVSVTNTAWLRIRNSTAQAIPARATTRITCLPPPPDSCGNRRFEPELGEECDPTVPGSPPCNSKCKLVECGDRRVDAGWEECEDQNNDDTDGCHKCKFYRKHKEVCYVGGRPCPAGTSCVNQMIWVKGDCFLMFCEDSYFLHSADRMCLKPSEIYR